MGTELLEVSDACCSVEDSAVGSKRWAVLDVITAEAAPCRVTVGGVARLMSNNHGPRSEAVSVDATVGCYYHPFPFPGDDVTNHGCDGTTTQRRNRPASGKLTGR